MWATGIAALATCFYAAGAPVFPQAAIGKALATPFTLETERYHFEKSPRGELRERDLTARRSDGAKVMTSARPLDKPPKWIHRLIRFADGREIRLDDSLRIKTTWPPSPADEIARLQALQAPPDCVGMGERLLRYEKVLNHNVAVVYGFHDTHWRAPDLGCVDLRYRIDRTNPDGSLGVVVEQRAVRLKLGEPDPQLFDEGADDTELKPSEVLRRETAQRGIPWDGHLQEQAEAGDKAYLRRRSRDTLRQKQ